MCHSIHMSHILTSCINVLRKEQQKHLRIEIGLLMKSCSVTIQMKAIEQYFPVMLFVMLYRVVLTFESVDESFKCDDSIESYWVALPCGAVYYAVQGGSIFWVCRWNF